MIERGAKMFSFRSDKLKASLHSKILHFLKVVSNLVHIMKVCFGFSKVSETTKF